MALGDLLGALAGSVIEEDAAVVAAGGLGGAALASPCLRATPCASSGGGTGVLEGLGLNLEGALAVASAAQGLLAAAAATTGQRQQQHQQQHQQQVEAAGVRFPALLALQAALALWRAFSPVLRGIFSALVSGVGSGGGGGGGGGGSGGGTGGGGRPLSERLALALERRSAHLDFAAEERARRGLALLEAFEGIRGAAGEVAAGEQGSSGASPLLGGIARAVAPAARQLAILFDAWARAL